MEKTLLLSVVIGFFAASPFGPMGLLCVRRALLHGFTSGILSAMGIATAYAFWAYVTVCGLASFSDWIDQRRRPLGIAVGLFLVLYGLRAVMKSARYSPPCAKSRNRAGQFLSTSLVVLLNPTTFVQFSVLLTIAGIAGRPFGALRSIEIALAVLIGTMVFWLAASCLIHRTRGRAGEAVLAKVSRVAAVGVMAFGAAILVCAAAGLP